MAAAWCFDDLQPLENDFFQTWGPGPGPEADLGTKINLGSIHDFNVCTLTHLGALMVQGNFLHSFRCLEIHKNQWISVC